MSKLVKQMQLDTLKKTFGNVRDLVLLSIKGMPAITEHQLRHALRKKNVHLMQVKNSLARLAFKDLGITIAADSPYWAESTTFAWGGNSVADLSRSIESELKAPKTQAQYKDKIKIKGAIAEGQIVSFDIALKMPTRQEAIANVLSLILAPASRLVGQITGPASSLVGQIKQVGEKKEETPAEAAPPAAG